MKSFSKWSIENVEETFQVVLQKHSDLLNQWMTLNSPLSEELKEQLVLLREKLQDHVWDWNEEELKVYFIIPLLNLVNFEQPQYKPFLSRELSMIHDNEKVSGMVDFIIASGKRSPKRPFFFIHEYKKEHDSSDDPLGQLMIVMITAQQLNNDNHPVYGAYVMGRYWHFVVLDGLSYTVHTGLNAADEELIRIYNVLVNTKTIITKWV